jgi:hypothetical protein
MALPVVNSSRYTATIPSTGRQIEFRPYLVKEEKILMVALESKDDKQILGAIKDVLKSCIFDDIDTSTLTSFDLEELFLRLRAKSVGENIDLKFKCSECEYENPVTVNLDDVKMGDLTDNRVIMINEEIGIKFNYPALDVLQEVKVDPEKDSQEKQLKGMMTLLIGCIDSIFDDDNVYPASDQTKEELQDFIDGLNAEQFGRITEFFNSIPTLTHDLSFKCNKCGEENEMVVRGLQSFFT